jgi:hypothetical protein
MEIDVKPNPQVLLDLNIGAVIEEDLFEPEVIAGPIELSFEERVKILNGLKQLDIEVGSVVTKRSNYPTSRVMPFYWGIVMNMVSYLNNSQEFKPYVVRWLDGTTSYLDYKELILISFAPDAKDLELIKLEPFIGDL